MLDVHPPHEKIHGFRDFLLHLLTITIGLLIALGLEGLVARSHHHHLRDEANENIRREIEDNRKELSGLHATLTREQANLDGIYKYLQAHSQSKPYEIHSISVGLALASLKAASWQTASATTALSYMEYATVQKYAAAYDLQAQVLALQNQALADSLNLTSDFYSFNPDTFPPADAEKAKEHVRLVSSRLSALSQLADSLNKEYETALH